MSIQIEEGIIAILYRTMKHRITSSDIALSIISTIKRIVPETGVLSNIMKNK